jgi:hypothetical protein
MMVAISYSPLHSALPILLHYSCGVSIAPGKLLMNLDIPLYSQAPSNISTLMVAKMEKISSECSTQVTGLRSGFSTALETFQVLHIDLLEAHSMIKRFLSLNIQIIMSPPSTQKLL